MHSGDETGTITVGKRADLVLLATERFGFPRLGSLADRVVNFAHRRDVDSVWAAGVLRKSAGQMVGVDWAQINAQRLAVQKRVFDKAATITITGGLYHP